MGGGRCRPQRPEAAACLCAGEVAEVQLDKNQHRRRNAQLASPVHRASTCAPPPISGCHIALGLGHCLVGASNTSADVEAGGTCKGMARGCPHGAVGDAQGNTGGMRRVPATQPQPSAVDLGGHADQVRH